MLFKNWKHVFKHMYQTDPKTFRTIRNSSNMLAINNYKKKKKKLLVINITMAKEITWPFVGS